MFAKGILSLVASFLINTERLKEDKYTRHKNYNSITGETRGNKLINN